LSSHMPTQLFHGLYICRMPATHAAMNQRCHRWGYDNADGDGGRHLLVCELNGEDTWTAGMGWMDGG